MKAQSKRIIIKGIVNQENQILLNKYEQHINIKNLAPKTIGHYLNDLENWMRYLNSEQGDLLAINVTEDDIEEYVYFRMKQGNNEDRVKRVCSSISAFYKFLRKKRMIIENPMEFFDRPKKCEEVRNKYFLTMSQVKKMKEGISSMNDIRIDAYIALSVSTAGRISAIQTLRWDMINLEERIIEDVLEKGRKTVELTFSEEVRDLLVQLKEHYKKEGIILPYVFITKYHGEYRCVGQTTLRKWARLAGEFIGIPDFTPHSFRRSCATILKDNNIPLEDISEKLNHKGSDVTKLYVKANKKKMREMQDAVGI
ncbi:MAG: tyrosine-type recombinase/integrase [Paraclostridium sp.]